ncbi:MAG: hypothetical protein ACOYOT_06985 [Bacteroidales bacterium]
MLELIKVVVIFGISFFLASFFLSCWIPNKWLFQYRFWFFGMMTGLLFSMIYLITTHANDICQVCIDTVSSLLVGSLLLGGVLRWYFLDVEENTPYPKYYEENEIVSDTAKLICDSSIQSGRIVLTEKRLTFLSKSRGRAQFDFYLSDPNFKIDVVCRFGIPWRLKVFNNDICIDVKFPGFWKKQILNVLYKSA